MSAQSAGAFERAAERIRSGGLLAYPTETVFGLGADARSDAALERLRRFKGRGREAPISILVGAAGVGGAVDVAGVLVPLGFEPGPAARALAERFWPGPLTLVMPCKRRFAAGVARADGAVGVRCSPHPAAARLAAHLAEAGVGPITATSLNRSGEPAARSRDEARVLCEGGGADAPALLEVPEEAGGGRESTVVDLCGARPELLRQGAIAEGELRAALERLEGTTP